MVKYVFSKSCCGKDFSKPFCETYVQHSLSNESKTFCSSWNSIFWTQNFCFNFYVYYVARSFTASTRAFNLITRAFNLPTRDGLVSKPVNSWWQNKSSLFHDPGWHWSYYILSRWQKSTFFDVHDKKLDSEVKKLIKSSFLSVGWKTVHLHKSLFFEKKKYFITILHRS